MDQNSEHARCCLEAAGFQAIYIDESDEERADLLVSDDTAQYVLEVKGKEVPDEFRTMVAESDEKGIASISRRISYKNRLDGIIRKAHSQLVTTPYPTSTFRVLWISCLLGDADFIHEQFEFTLFGKEELVVLPKDFQGTPSVLTCFYYNNSSFYRYKGLDAVILSGPKGGHLCINEFSNRSSSFRLSKMYGYFPETAIIDPWRLEQAGKALAIRTTIDRSDSQAKWKYIFDTYGYMLAPTQIHSFTGLISVPLKEMET